MRTYRKLALFMSHSHFNYSFTHSHFNYSFTPHIVLAFFNSFTPHIVLAFDRFSTFHSLIWMRRPELA